MWQQWRSNFPLPLHTFNKRTRVEVVWSFESTMNLVAVLKTIVLKDISRFAMLYGFVLISYSLAFHVVSAPGGADDGGNGHISSVFYAIYTVFCQMLGMEDVYNNLYNGLDNTGSFHTVTLVYVRLLFMAYISVSAIIFLNLLIATMNDTYEDAVKKAKDAVKADNMRMLSRTIIKIMSWEQNMPRLVRCVLRFLTRTQKPEKIENELRWNITVDATKKVKCKKVSKGKKELADKVEKVSQENNELADKIETISQQNKDLEGKLSELLTTLKQLQPQQRD